MPVIFVQRELDVDAMKRLMGWIRFFAAGAVVIACDARGVVSDQDLGRLGASRRGAMMAVDVKREARRDLARKYGVPAPVPITCSENPRFVRPLLAGALAAPPSSTELSRLSDRIASIGRIPAGADDLAEWLESEGWEWLVRGRVQLAAVLNAAAQLALSATAGVIADALEYPATIQPILQVAIQRIRWVPITEPVRIRMARELRRRIEGWEMTPADHPRAAAAMPSLVWVAGAGDVSWIRDRLQRGAPRIAQGAAHGLVDWASGERVSPAAGGGAKELLLEAAIARWREARKDPGEVPLAAALVWAAGAVSGAEDVPRVAQVFAEAFAHPVGLEDAASVRGGRILVRRFGASAVRVLRDAFGDEGWSRYEAHLGVPEVGV